MNHDSERRYRRSIRLKGYDYTQPGAYFVTVCTEDRACLFGEVVDGQMRWNAFGEIVRECWSAIPDHCAQVALDAFVIMPNHVHGIVWIVDPYNDNVVGARYVGARHAVPLPLRSQSEQFGKPVSGSIPTIVRSFKSATTRRINERRQTPGAPIWQRNYYEHIIRNEESLTRIREYILTNPLRWHLDRDNPDCTGKDDAWDCLFGPVRAGSVPARRATETSRARR